MPNFGLLIYIGQILQKETLLEAIAAYQKRERRFGGFARGIIDA